MPFTGGDVVDDIVERIFTWSQMSADSGEGWIGLEQIAYCIGSDMSHRCKTDRCSLHRSSRSRQ